MKNYCRNCYHPLPYKARFCAHCGQKNSDGKVPVGDVLQQLWFRILHLESRSWRVLWRLFVPAQVSIDYFKGKRKRYPPPVQFFFIIMFFFLLLINHSVGEGGFYVQKLSGGYHIGYTSDKNRVVDLYSTGKRYFETRRLLKSVDSLPAAYRTPLVKAALDTLLHFRQDSSLAGFQAVFGTDRDSLRKKSIDSISLSFRRPPVTVASEDLFLMDPEQIIRYYHIHRWYDRLMVRQYIKTMEAPSVMVRTFLGSLAWTLLVLVGLMAGVLTLLYRRRHYFVEHFIFLLHEHTSVFLILTIAMLIQQFFPPFLPGWVLLGGWLTLASLISMRRYYGQGWMLTFTKWSLLCFAYLVAFAILFTIGLLVAFLIF